MLPTRGRGKERAPHYGVWQLLPVAGKHRFATWSQESLWGRRGTGLLASNRPHGFPATNVRSYTATNGVYVMAGGRWQAIGWIHCSAVQFWRFQRQALVTIIRELYSATSRMRASLILCCWAFLWVPGRSSPLLNNILYERCLSCFAFPSAASKIGTILASPASTTVSSILFGGEWGVCSVGGLQEPCQVVRLGPALTGVESRSQTTTEGWRWC